MQIFMVSTSKIHYVNINYKRHDSIIAHPAANGTNYASLEACDYLKNVVSVSYMIDRLI